jgi:hypothetical protein
LPSAVVQQRLNSMMILAFSNGWGVAAALAALAIYAVLALA